MSSSKAAYTHCLHVFWKPLPQLCVGSTQVLSCLPLPFLLPRPLVLGLPGVRATRGEHAALRVLGVSGRQCGSNRTPRANSSNSRRPPSRFQRPRSLSQVSAGLFPMRAVERICSSLPPGSRGLRRSLGWWRHHVVITWPSPGLHISFLIWEAWVQVASFVRMLS